MDFDGSDNIYSTCNGVVDSVNYSSAYGNYIIIKEENVQRYHYFCHLNSVKVKRGDKVTRATLIGIMGTTGNVTGKHLHYEIRNKKILTSESLINPAEYIGIPNLKGSYNSKDYQINSNKPTINYEVYCQNLEWLAPKTDGELAGTKGQGLRIEAIKIDASENIKYRVHMEEKGWSEYVPNGFLAGTMGESRRIECIEIETSKTPIHATAHIQDVGDVDYGIGTHLKIGTEGKALRLEALSLEFA